ncbi:MAG TPA: TetR/AcrR family transcriptional regulator [Acidimicrobiales bacterium]|jgi:AcrR family transcriptional regulator
MGRIAGVTPEETRTRLVQAAVQVFAERGYEGARVTDIAREAGLSSGAIYAHYCSKAELLVDAIRAHGPKELSRLIAAGDVRTPVPDLLVRLGSSLEQRDGTQGSLLLEAMAAARRDPELATVLATNLADREGVIASLVRHGQDTGDLDDDVSADVLARFCLLVVLGAMVARVLDLPRTDPTDWSHFIARLVDGLRAEENP